jgi:hypothetical protein
MPTTTFENWGQALMASATSALALVMMAIPRIIGFVLILLIGWLIASLVARAVAGLLRAVNFNNLAERSGFSGFVQNMGVRTDASGFLALIAKWFIRLITLVVAFDALGLPAVSEVLQSLLLWLPNLVVAMVVLVIAGLAANALFGVVRGSTAQAGFGNPDLLGNIARVAVLAFGVVVAVNQLGIAVTLVNTLFMATVGAIALALGLAFGLGGRDTAGQIVRDWYAAGRNAAPKMERAAGAAREQTQGRPGRTSTEPRPRGAIDPEVEVLDQEPPEDERRIA